MSEPASEPWAPGEPASEPWAPGEPASEPWAPGEPASEQWAAGDRAGTRLVRGHRAPRRGGFLRGLSGVLAGGLVALVAALVVAWVVALRLGSPGPGVGVVAVHTVGAAGAVALQVYADRTRGPRGSLAALGVTVLVAAVLTYEWLI